MAWLISAILGLFAGLGLAQFVSLELVRRNAPRLGKVEAASVVLATTVTFCALTWRFLDTHVTVIIAYLFCGALCVAVAAIDFKIHKIPNRFLFPSFGITAVLLGVATIFGGSWQDLTRALAGVLLGYGLFYLLSLTRAMGLGDVKLAALLAAYCGWLGWSTAGAGIILAFLAGGLWTLILIIMRRAHRQTAIAFGPWLCVGALLAILISA